MTPQHAGAVHHQQRQQRRQIRQPAFDKLIEESRVADKATHFEKLHEAEDMLMADAACIPVAYYNDFWLQSPSLKGTWHSPYGYWYLQYGYIEE